MSVLGFSPRVYETVRTFMREHPVIEISVGRAADFGSPLVYLAGGVCEECGWTWSPDRTYVEAMDKSVTAQVEELPRGMLPSDYLEAIEWTHGWDQASRAVYCGGRIALSTAAVKPV